MRLFWVWTIDDDDEGEEKYFRSVSDFIEIRRAKILRMEEESENFLRKVPDGGSEEKGKSE